MSKKINWKKLKKRENFFLKTGRMPTDSEMKSVKGKPRLMFGFNTISR